MRKIAIDPGYGYLKGMDDYGNVIRFPALVAAAHDRSLDGILGGGSLDGLNNLHVEYEDHQGKQEFFVGELARESRNASYSFEQNKINHTNTRVLIATASAILSSAGDSRWIGVGLPLEYFKTQGEEMKRMLSEFNAKVRLIETGYERHITFDRATVYAQGATSVYDALLLHNGMPRHPELMKKSSMIGLVNWGTRTVDVVVFKVGDTFKVQSELSFTLDDAGAMEIRRKIQQAFQKETGFPISVVDAENILNEGGQTFYAGKEYDFSEAIETSKRNITRLVLDSLQNRWGNRSGFIRKVFFAGGTVNDVKHLLTNHPLSHQFYLVDDPQMSDARGMLHLMKLQEKRELEAQKMGVSKVSIG